ncbi:MAG: ribosome maturation factor RimM [Actinomycetota bacterium]
MLLAGKIGKPHGLGGDVYVEKISDDPRRFESGSRLIHEDGRELVVVRARPHRDRFLVTFEGYRSRDEVEGLRGTLFVPDEEVRSLGEDEYWPDDLIGCTVVDPQGNRLGEVTDISLGAAQDLLEVMTDRGERLVPLVKKIVTHVDVEAQRVTIEPPEGLLD